MRTYYGYKTYVKEYVPTYLLYYTYYAEVGYLNCNEEDNACTYHWTTQESIMWGSGAYSGPLPGIDPKTGKKGTKLYLLLWYVLSVECCVAMEWNAVFFIFDSKNNMHNHTQQTTRIKSHFLKTS
jgi:hypothetical protein